MMNKKELIKLVQDIRISAGVVNISPQEMAVGAGGAMVLLNLNEEVGGIDLFVSHLAWNKLLGTFDCRDEKDALNRPAAKFMFGEREVKVIHDAHYIISTTYYSTACGVCIPSVTQLIQERASIIAHRPKPKEQDFDDMIKLCVFRSLQAADPDGAGLAELHYANNFNPLYGKYKDGVVAAMLQLTGFQAAHDWLQRPSVI